MEQSNDEVNMSAYGATLTVLVTQLIDAVVKDEGEEGHDIGCGLIGEHTSNWLRDVAENVSREKRPPRAVEYTPLVYPSDEDACTNEDRRMVVYFIRDKGDITRWTEWESRKSIICEAYPDLAFALTQRVTAYCLMNAALDRIDRDDTGE